MRKRNTGFKMAVLLLIIFSLPFYVAWPKDIGSRMPHNRSTAMITVLNYHKVDDMPISLSIPPAEFDAQMAYLRDNGYTTISPDDLWASLESDAPLPDKPVLITFDDGYADNYKNAYPILKKYGYRATIFVITDFLSANPNYITWDQAREMQSAGITIASHTMQHKSLTGLTDDEIRAELNGSKAALEYQLGAENIYFAYPTGTYSIHIMKLVQEAGYKGAFTIKYGDVDAASSLFALERVPVFQTENTFESFRKRIEHVPFFERIGWIKS